MINKGKINFLLLLISIMFFSGCIGSSGHQLLKQAENLEQQKKFKEALLTYFKLIKTNDKESILAANKAARVAHYELSDFNKAIIALDYILINSKDDEQRLKAQNHKADIYFSGLNDYSRSIEELSKLMLITSDQHEKNEIKFKIAKAYYYLNNFQQSLIELNGLLKSVNKDEDIFEILYFKGSVLMTVKKMEEAIDIFKMLLEKYPEKSKKENVKLSLIVCLEEKEKFSEAIALLETLRGEEDQKNFVDLRIKRLQKRIENMPKGKVR